jgi:hypothetical protein
VLGSAGFLASYSENSFQRVLHIARSRGHPALPAHAWGERSEDLPCGAWGEGGGGQTEHASSFAGACVGVRGAKAADGWLERGRPPAGRLGWRVFGGGQNSSGHLASPVPARGARGALGRGGLGGLRPAPRNGGRAVAGPPRGRSGWWEFGGGQTERASGFAGARVGRAERGFALRSVGVWGGLSVRAVEWARTRAPQERSRAKAAAGGKERGRPPESEAGLWPAPRGEVGVAGVWGRAKFERASGFASAREGGSGGTRPRWCGRAVAGPPKERSAAGPQHQC